MRTTNEKPEADYKMVYAGVAEMVMTAWEKSGYTVINVTADGKLTMKPVKGSEMTYQIHAGQVNLILRNELARMINEKIKSSGNSPETIGKQFINFEF